MQVCGRNCRKQDEVRMENMNKAADHKSVLLQKCANSFWECTANIVKGPSSTEKVVLQALLSFPSDNLKDAYFRLGGGSGWLARQGRDFWTVGDDG